MLPRMLKFLLIAILITNHGFAQYRAPFFNDTLRKQKIEKLAPIVEHFFANYASEQSFPGFAYGVVLDGELLIKGAGGYLDLATKIPASTNSYFRIASMSKSFTAMAILHLRDLGKLKLDDPVEQYIPVLKGQKLTSDAAAITIRHLLTHGAGFPEDNPWGDRQLAVTELELLAMVKKGIGFSNPTDQTYEYSNLGFALLGAIIQKLTGMSYGQYIQTHIWKPLNMENASWEFGKIPEKQLAHGYRKTKQGFIEEPLLKDGIYGAMGGMITSVESFAKYVAFHQSARPARNEKEMGPIKRSSLREMQMPWRLSDPGAAYGYGLRWYQDVSSKEWVGHTGGLPGFGSNWLILPDYGIGVIFFANLTYAPTRIANVRLLDTLVKLAGLQKRELPVSKILQQSQERLVKILPNFSSALHDDLFAQNFFLDYPIQDLQRDTEEKWMQAGKIISIGKMIPENQLRGYCILVGEKAKLKLNFTLSPENPAKIQEYQLAIMPN